MPIVDEERGAPLALPIAIAPVGPSERVAHGREPPQPPMEGREEQVFAFFFDRRTISSRLPGK
jgi:hypothetical protein